MNVLALIPARAGSKGIPGKNFNPLAGLSPIERALDCARAIGAMPTTRIVISTDSEFVTMGKWTFRTAGCDGFLLRPHELAQDDTPMIDVVKHALSEIPGPEDQIILLLQPTQPLRQPKHLTAAIELLQTSGADSVVSVVELPLTHNPAFVLEICEWTANNPRACLMPYDTDVAILADQPSCRQDVESAYVRDGTVYAFRRSTVSRFGNIYGECVCPIIIDPSETTPLDTPADWARAEELLRAR